MKARVERIEEVVLAAENIEDVVVLFEKAFGVKFNEKWSVEADNMDVRCARIGETQFHIVGTSEPSENSVIRKFLDQRGEGLHHIAFKVNGLDEMLSHLRKMELKLIPDQPILGKRGVRYIFIHPRSIHGCLIELIEESKAKCVQKNA